MKGTRYRPLRGTRGAIVGGHPAAVAAGARILDRGGSAVDAIVATAAAMTVARPHMCGVAGDGFLLVHDAASRRIHAINAGGPAPAAASPERFPGGIPDRGPHISTVPGIVDGWRVAHERFGTMKWSEVLEPAVELADAGLPVYESLAGWFSYYAKKYAADPACAQTYFPRGRPPRTGEILAQPELSRTLARLAEAGPRDFYEGEIARTYGGFMRAAGGLTTEKDLAAYHATCSEPISVEYRGHTVHTQPPMSQGWMLLQMLAAMETLDVRTLGAASPALVPAMVSAVEAAFEDRHRLFGDPAFVDFSLDRVLSPRRIAAVRAALEAARAGTGAGDDRGDTTTLSAIDARGDAVSMIQSLWIDAGVMIPGTGILLNARLNSCNVMPGHPDAVAGGKTPVYTMHTYMVTRDGVLELAGGTPGGNSQVQTNLQVITNVLDFGMNAQEAVEAPRFVLGGALHHDAARSVYLEGRFAETTAAALGERGYAVSMLPEWAALELEGQTPMTVGSAKAICVDPVTGVRTTGVDPRREGHGHVS